MSDTTDIPNYSPYLMHSDERIDLPVGLHPDHLVTASVQVTENFIQVQVFSEGNLFRAYHICFNGSLGRVNFVQATNGQVIGTISQ